MPTASLVPFEMAASCFDSAVMAARAAMVAPKWRHGGDASGGLIEINDMLRHLKRQARAAIGQLATSDVVEHRAMAEACRVRMADAINLHRTASCCIRRGVAPPPPAMYAALKTGPGWPQPWPCHQAWLVAWVMVWRVALTPVGR